jgi:hypothetical protein
MDHWQESTRTQDITGQDLECIREILAELAVSKENDQRQQQQDYQPYVLSRVRHEALSQIKRWAPFSAKMIRAIDEELKRHKDFLNGYTGT